MTLLCRLACGLTVGALAVWSVIRETSACGSGLRTAIPPPCAFRFCQRLYQIPPAHPKFALCEFELAGFWNLS